MQHLRFLIILFLLCLSNGCGVRPPAGTEFVRNAEEFTRKADYDSAIRAYRRHISSRLSDSDRPEWENPWFYLLLIGDLQLRQSHPDEALTTYLQAASRGIHESLISDRVRMVASWHEAKGQIGEAMAILSAHKALDPLLFDASLDRLAKELSRKENAASKTEPLSLEIHP